MLTKNIFLRILTAVAVIFFFSIQNLWAFYKNGSPEYEIAQTLAEYNRALKKRDFHKLFQYHSKYKQSMLASEDEYKKNFQILLEKNVNYAKYLHRVHIGPVKMITDNRAWVELSHPKLPDLKAYYMVKEEGKWKKGGLPVLLEKACTDMRKLNISIKRFYGNQGHFPSDLFALIPEYIDEMPLDPFGDQPRVYTYEIVNKTTWRLYSIGIDSHDDLGKVAYPLPKNSTDFEKVGFDSGDIIIEDHI